ncbi:MAG: response regulator [Myxococcota bacterium]
MSGRIDDRRATYRVLLLDDSEISLEVAAEVLRRDGFEVRTALDLDGFDGHLTDWSPQVILTDVNMPGMTGNELCRQLKRRYETAHVPVVLCSSLAPEELARLARACEADGFVTKSDDLEGLADEVRALCETILW